MDPAETEAGTPPMNGSPRLLDRVRARARRLGLSRRAEKAYVGWCRRFILANGKRHPDTMGASEVEAFLTALAVQHNVSASTQNQALAALLFLYRQVLEVDLPWMEGVQRAKRPVRLPSVLSRDEVATVLAELDGTSWLVASLLYGSGLRLLECLQLRVKDVDLLRHEVTVRNGKGGRDRRTVPSARLVPRIQELIGHQDVATTQIYTHVLNRGGRGVRSPLDP